MTRASKAFPLHLRAVSMSLFFMVQIFAQPRTASPVAAAPSEKEIIRLLMKMGDLPLKGLEGCALAGTSPSDRDIGDYVSGWLAQLKSGPGSNWVQSSATAESTPAKEKVWRCVVMFRHKDGDDRWGWGVSFLVRGTDRQPVRSSVRCVGAG